jgi:carbon monoxide dehydrogenase subunit G
LKVLKPWAPRLVREDEPCLIRADEAESPRRPTTAPTSLLSIAVKGGSMTKIERSIVIERPVEEVWEFVHDPANDLLWQTTLTESEELTEGPMRVGTRVREVRRFLGVRIETAWEVTEYEPTTRSGIRATSGPIPFSGGYRLESTGSGTSFNVQGELDAHGVFKLAEPVFARIAGRELETNLAHLKDLLEAS